MAKVLMPLAHGFEEIEALAVVDILRRAGIEVVLAGILPGPIVSSREVSVNPDTTIETVMNGTFDMIVLPGGQPGTDNMNADPRIHKILKKFAAKNRYIAAICAAPIILAASGLLTGRKATCYPTYREHLEGSTYMLAPVVIDGTIITSRGAGTAIPFALELVALLAGREQADSLAAAMLIEESPQKVWDPRLFNTTLQALLGAMELKDSYSQGQALRVAEYCLSIGAKLNFSRIELRDLYLGAMLHDIGKYSTADEVLNKPSRLNFHEETLSREHTLKGTLLVVGNGELGHLGPTILHHHEHWDGSGYPSRLKGEQIPLHARIVAVADSYDAMTSNRSYRQGLDRESALRELIKKKGAQFDPFIVDVFIKCLEESPYGMKDFTYYFSGVHNGLS